VELALLGKLDEIISYFQQAIEMNRKLYPNGHPSIASILGNVATLRYRQGMYAQAEPAMRDAIAEGIRVLGAEYPDIGYDKNSLANILIHLGKLDEAAMLLEEASVEIHKQFGDKHPNAASVISSRAVLAAARGDHAQAVQLEREAIAMDEALLPPTNNKITSMRLVLGENLFALGKYEEARAELAIALTNARTAKTPLPIVIAHAQAAAALVEDALGQNTTASQLREEAASSLSRLPPGPNGERDEVHRLLSMSPPVRSPSATGSANANSR
jgi:serine/threonine-protein kinase